MKTWDVSDSGYKAVLFAEDEPGIETIDEWKKMGSPYVLHRVQSYGNIVVYADSSYGKLFAIEEYLNGEITVHGIGNHILVFNGPTGAQCVYLDPGYYGPEHDGILYIGSKVR